jgi:Flp pilus assembly pilin Flp
MPTLPGTRREPSRLRVILMRLSARLATNDGATAIEYALIAASIGAAVAATVWSLGTATQGLYAGIAALL